MAVTVTNSAVLAYMTVADRTANAATSTTVDEAEVFTITPTKSDSRVLMEVAVANTHGSVVGTFAAGGMQNGKAGAVTFAQNKTHLLMIDGSRHVKADGTISVSFAPATGKRLLTDHALSVAFIELPG